MKKIITLSAALLLAFSASVQAAEEWGIEHEKKARFTAKVVDVACELTGDCPANCGAGKRQLGLLKEDGLLWLVVKNGDPFAGAVNDLIGFCGKKVIADGLEIRNPKMHLFQLQFKRLAPDGKWSRATQFSKDWAKKNNEKFADEWWERDKLVKEALADGGILGIPGLKPPAE
jgi:hypothetical protein